MPHTDTESPDTENDQSDLPGSVWREINLLLLLSAYIGRYLKQQLWVLGERGGGGGGIVVCSGEITKWAQERGVTRRNAPN